MDKLYIVIPAYNEQDNIRAVIDQWYPIIEKIGGGSRLVIINDGSSDNTYTIMQECASTRPYFIPVTKKNGGHGAAVLYAYHYALQSGADYIFQTDSDGQTVPEEFWQFWELRNRYDLIIGHRSKRQDGFSRIIVTKILKIVIRFCFGVQVTDANTPFRLMDSRTLRDNINLIPENYNLSNVLLTVIYERKKLNVKYIPITFRARQGGVNSINLPKIFKIGFQALKDFSQIDHYLKKYQI